MSFTKLDNQVTGALNYQASLTQPHWKFHYASVALNSAPTTSQNLVVSIKSAKGAAYDVELLRRDLSAQSDTDILISPEKPYQMENGDSIDFQYTNTDTRTISIIVGVEN